MTRRGIKTYIINDNVTLTSPKCSVVLYLHLVQGLRYQKFSTEIFEISHMCYRNINTNAWKFSLWSLFFYLGRATSPQTFGTYLVYSPRKRQTIHWGQKFYDNRKAFSLCPYVASFEMISSKSDFIHIFNDFIHVYSPGARAENPWGQTFDINRKPLPLLPFVAGFKQISLNSDFIHIF